MNYIRKRCGRGFSGNYATPYGGKKKSGKPKHPTYQVYNGPRTKFFKGKGISFNEKASNSGTYVV
jgi:hypothetical protein